MSAAFAFFTEEARETYHRVLRAIPAESPVAAEIQAEAVALMALKARGHRITHEARARLHDLSRGADGLATEGR